MKHPSDALLHFLGRCIAPAPDVFRPCEAERRALAEEISRLEHMHALTDPESPSRDLVEAMLDAALHRLKEGCFCKAGEAVALQRVYSEVGLLRKLPGYAR